MSNRANLLWWLTTGKEGRLSGFSDILEDYFQLTDEQFDSFQNFFNISYHTIMDTSITDSYCAQFPDLPCDRQLIFAMQWTQQIITLEPPVPSIVPFPSITYTNVTIVGYP